MNLTDIGAFLFGGPAAAGATAAKGLFGEIDDLVSQFNLAPEKKLAFEQKMAELKLAGEQLRQNAVQMAQNREIQTKDSQTPRELAIGTVLGAAVVMVGQLGLFMFWPERAAQIPAAAWAQIGQISNFLMLESKFVYSYYFGASAGEDDMIRSGYKPK